MPEQYYALGSGSEAGSGAGTIVRSSGPNYLSLIYQWQQAGSPADWSFGASSRENPLQLKRYVSTTAARPSADEA